MSEKWKHLGPAEEQISRPLWDLMRAPHNELVENTETEEQRVVIVGYDETVGEAIAEGRFEENDDEEDEGWFS